MKAAVIFVAFLLIVSASGRLRQYIKWQIISYKNLPSNGGASTYDAYVNVPFGVARYKNKLFVTIPRRNPGIPSTLNIVDPDMLKTEPPHINPRLIGYPNYQVNALSPSNRADPSKIVSVYRVRIDRCERLWFIDTGVLEYPDNQIIVQRPSIWAININTDAVIGRFEIPESVTSNGAGLASLTIDDADCANSYAYIPDWLNSNLIVFSVLNNKAWRFNHNYFRSNPFEGDFSVDGQQFQWNDGIFSIALSNPKPNGFRTAFFHPLASQDEFTVSTQVLRNEVLSTRRTHGNDFKFIGQRGANSQSGSHVLDPQSNVLFFAQMQQNAVNCWNVKGPRIKPGRIHTVQQNNATLIYPVDLTIDNESTLYVLSNRLPRFLYDRYNIQEFNFNVYRGTIKSALEGTGCFGLGNREDFSEEEDF